MGAQALLLNRSGCFDGRAGGGSRLASYMQSCTPYSHVRFMEMECCTNLGIQYLGPDVYKRDLLNPSIYGVRHCNALEIQTRLLLSPVPCDGDVLPVHRYPVLLAKITDLSTS